MPRTECALLEELDIQLDGRERLGLDRELPLLSCKPNDNFPPLDAKNLPFSKRSKSSPSRATEVRESLCSSALRGPQEPANLWARAKDSK